MRLARGVAGTDCFADGDVPCLAEREDPELRGVPPFDEVGVPPTVIATYSLPPTAKIVGPAAIGAGVFAVHSTLPVFVSNARMTPSPPPAKPSPVAVVVTPPRSGSGVSNFQTRLPVETSIALIEPWSFQPGSAEPKLPLSSPRKTSPTSLSRSCVGVSRSGRRRPRSRRRR